MTVHQNISEIQTKIPHFSPQALHQVERGRVKVEHDFLASRDATTHRIISVLENNTIGLPTIDGINFGTESGSLTYASLLYATPADAAKAFDDPVAHQYVYLRDGTICGNILSKAVQGLDPAATDARITAFGMGAIWSALSVLRTGDHIVASDKLFGTTKARLLDFPESRGIAVSFVDGTNPTAWQAALIPGRTKAFFYEPVANPSGEVTDTTALARLAQPHDILVIADSSATPLGEFLAQGADVVAVSLTKLLGLGDSSGGAVLTATSALAKLGRQRPGLDVTKHNPFLDAISPFGWNQSPEVSARQLHRIPKAPTRHRRQVSTSVQLANWIVANYEIHVLASSLTHPHDARLHSQIFSLDFGSEARAFAFAQKLGPRSVNNFGGPTTTLTIPRSTTHKALSPEQLDAQGIGEGLLRLSVGIEDAGYLRKELASAFAAANILKRPSPQRLPATLQVDL